MAKTRKTAAAFVAKIKSRLGRAIYRFGAEVKPTDPDPRALDCSETSQWAAAQLGVELPDGSWLQYRHCHKAGTTVTIDVALLTAGALLFIFSSSPLKGGRPKLAHVAISLGDGERTIEARSTKAGFGVFAGARFRGWTHAALVPGLEYPKPSSSSKPSSSKRKPAAPKLPTLREGARGPAVVKLQSLLHAEGLAGPTGRVDGLYGGKTAAGVREFQRREGIAVDGIVGPQTWGRLLDMRVEAA